MKKLIILALSNDGNLVYVSGDRYSKPASYDKVKKDAGDYSLCLFGEGFVFIHEGSAKKAIKALTQGKPLRNVIYENGDTIPDGCRKAFLSLRYKNNKLTKNGYAISEKSRVGKEEAEKALGKVSLVEIGDEKFYVSEVSRMINEKFQHCEDVMPILALNAEI